MKSPRATATMAVTVIVFVVASGLGVKLLTQKADTTSNAPTCENRTIAAGDPVTPNLITLNIYNASQKAGRANRVGIKLQRKGFLAGAIGNAPQPVKGSNVTVLTKDPTNPLVELVAKQFQGKVTYEAPSAATVTTDGTDGVSVVLGSSYIGTDPKAVRKITASRAVTVCLPIVSAS